MTQQNGKRFSRSDASAWTDRLLGPVVSEHHLVEELEHKALLLAARGARVALWHELELLF